MIKARGQITIVDLNDGKGADNITISASCNDGKKYNFELCYLEINGKKITTSSTIVQYEWKNGEYVRGSVTSGNIPQTRGLFFYYINANTLELIEVHIHDNYGFTEASCDKITIWIKNVKEWFESNVDYPVILAMIAEDASSCPQSLRDILKEWGGLEYGTYIGQRRRHYFITNINPTAGTGRGYEEISEDSQQKFITIPVVKGVGVVLNGTKGKDGTDGTDGTSPVVATLDITSSTFNVDDCGMEIIATPELIITPKLYVGNQEITISMVSFYSDCNDDVWVPEDDDYVRVDINQNNILTTYNQDKKIHIRFYNEYDNWLYGDWKHNLGDIVNHPTIYCSIYGILDGILYHATTALSLNAIPAAKEGAQGKQGKQIRPRGEWNKDDVYINNDTYRDVVMYNGSFYAVKNTKTSVPKNTLPSNTTYWDDASEYKFVATDLLMSEMIYAKVLQAVNARIDDLILNNAYAYKKKEDGTYDYTDPTVKILGDTGQFFAKNADLEGKITATSGSVGGFEIANGRIGVDREIVKDNTQLSLYQEFILFRDKYRMSLLGCTEITGAPYMLALEDKTPINLGTSEQDLRAHTLIAFNAPRVNSDVHRSAYSGTGNGVLNGVIEGYAVNVFSPSSSGNVIDYSKANKVIIKGTYGTCYLPKRYNIQNALYISNTTPFAVKLTVIGGVGASTRLWGRNGADTQDPILRNTNGRDTKWWDIAQGNTVTLELVYDGEEYNAFVTSYTQ